ncbi:MAG: DUF4430 domain-containing protein [Lachnospiraceae bacterium]|nr:DUF4430 domain-containing protein [Lachnospiraceae bacterium]
MISDNKKLIGTAAAVAAVLIIMFTGLARVKEKRGAEGDPSGNGSATASYGTGEINDEAAGNGGIFQSGKEATEKPVNDPAGNAEDARDHGKSGAGQSDVHPDQAGEKVLSGSLKNPGSEEDRPSGDRYDAVQGPGQNGDGIDPGDGGDNGGGSGYAQTPQNSAVSGRKDDDRYDLYVDSDGDGAYETTHSGLAEGEKVGIESGAGPYFRRWRVNSGKCRVSAAASPETTVTMGASDVYVWAVLADPGGTAVSKEETYDVCSFSITCKPFYDGSQQEIRNNLPSGGEILNATAVEIKDGDSVYDVLRRVCADKGIQYTARDTMYGIYISSIDNLSEKYYDGSAGWCYTVNGEYPPVSSSETSVKEGDSIQWIYDIWSF